MKDELFRNAYFEKMQSLENVLNDELGVVFWDEYFQLENGKKIAKIWVEKQNVSIYNKNTWQEIFEFFVEKMNIFETVFSDFEDFIKDI